MFKGRGGFWLFLIIVVLVVALILWLRGGGGLSLPFGKSTPTPTIPFDLQTVIPPGWSVQAEPQVQCDFDGDGEQETLLIYTYDATTVPEPLAAEPTNLTFAPFGGVIYDTQAGSLKPQPDNPGPYRTSNLVPYKLLPDYYAGKGQGYLGETSVDVRYWPAITTGSGCKTTEINIYGLSNGPLPTRLSVFRWAGIDAGYQVAHFAGDAWVVSAATTGGQINRVTTYNRLRNHRSVLCDVQGNVRPDLNLITFIPDAGVQTIDFCFGAPDEPVYPEAVVVAVLRAAAPPSTPELPSYFLDDAQIAPELQFLTRLPYDPVNINVLGNPSSVTPVAVRGQPCTAAQIGTTAAAAGYWCERERVRIETRIVLNGVPRDVEWILISVIPDAPNADLYWRITQANLP